MSRNSAVRIVGICPDAFDMALVQKPHKKRGVTNEKPDGVRAPIAYDSPTRDAIAGDQIVSDDWPADVPITAAEANILDVFLGDLLDAFLRPRH
jgi:hypothetical protein